MPEININEDIYMIGYNAGFILGQTNNGIQPQLNKGSITQVPYRDRLLYSIPAIGGSSGSPVMDKSGKVIAVNFAKFKDTDSFNFGIPINKVKQFLDN